MKKERIGNATLYHARMEDVIPSLRFDHIFTDPPYLYIKTHDFDKEFDEALLFENARRILPDNGFIALFGRGTSFYRWNTRLAELGFVFKEEIIWNKHLLSAPCIALSRIHETISIHTKKNGRIRHTKVPYIEQKQYNVESVINDIRQIKSTINTEAGLNEIMSFLQDVGQQSEIKKHDRVRARPIISFNGGNGVAISVDMPHVERRELRTMRMIQDGMREKSILEVKSDHYKLSHPAQKPVRLAERIIALISDPGDTIYDPFMGSGSFGVACLNTGRKYIGSETDEGYFNTACSRTKEAAKGGELFTLEAL
jgi:site-specific DNA-methyltransferase (adenine-specific)